MRSFIGQLAQLVEQRIENPRVRGSIPRLATIFKAQPFSVGLFHIWASPGCARFASILRVLQAPAGQPQGAYLPA